MIVGLNQSRTVMNRWLFVTLYATLSLAVQGCAANNATKGAVGGGALGAGLGAIVGNSVGHNTGAGIAIGTAAGALGGALIGNQFDQEDEANRRLGNRLAQNQSVLDENRRLIDELRRRGADVRSSRRGVVINLPDVLFEFDRANLTPEAHRTIAEISDVLRDVHRSISIEGHTDSIGTVVYNKHLSDRRAQSVEHELARNGVSESQMRSTGFGEGTPIATNNTEAGRARNRRVEVIVENEPLARRDSYGAASPPPVERRDDFRSTPPPPDLRSDPRARQY